MLVSPLQSVSVSVIASVSQVMRQLQLAEVSGNVSRDVGVLSFISIQPVKSAKSFLWLAVVFVCPKCQCSQSALSQGNNLC